MRHRRLYVIGAWLLLVAVASVVATRARYTADLSAFLPTAPTAAQRFLVQQLRDGLASRLILIDVEGADVSVRATLSRGLAARLRTQPAFRSVLNGEAGGSGNDRSFLFEHRYLLSEQVTAGRFAVPGLTAAISEGIDLLASPIGMLAKQLFTHDPTGESLQVLAQLEQSTTAPESLDGVWVSRDHHRTLLIAGTMASGSDADAQARAIDAIRAAFKAAQRDAGGTAAAAVLRLTGPGVFAAEARATITHEVVRLTVVSSLLIATLLLLVYRSIPLLLFGMLPVVSGALAGIAAVALRFGVVHGVTLGFGVTLIGEAVDYSIYLFIQARHGTGRNAEHVHWTRTLWPTIRLGMLTSICGFASLLPSGFPGLAQLGLYSITGLLAAGLVTRFVIPELMRSDLAPVTVMPIGRIFSRVLIPLRGMRRWLWLVAVLAVLVLYVQRERLWNHELAALSPVSAAAQQLDGDLRAELGAPDVRSMVVLAGDDEQAVLRAAESLAATLDTLVARGVIAGYQTPSRYLPSVATQLARQASLPARDELLQRLAAAVATLPVRLDRLQPFLDDVARARTAAPLLPKDLSVTSLAAGLDALLVRQSGHWYALLPLQASRAGAATIDVDRVAQAVRGTGTPGVEAVVLDLKRESDALYAGYLNEALRLSLIGFAAIILLLAVSLRSLTQLARVIAPLVLAVLAVLLGFALAGRALNILHLIGLLLVIAVGSNYALFFARQLPDDDAGQSVRMLSSLAVANLSTVIAFGVLAFSTVPVLSALGTTVAPGALLALLFAAVLSRGAMPAPGVR